MELDRLDMLVNSLPSTAVVEIPLWLAKGFEDSASAEGFYGAALNTIEQHAFGFLPVYRMLRTFREDSAGDTNRFWQQIEKNYPKMKRNPLTAANLAHIDDVFPERQDITPNEAITLAQDSYSQRVLEYELDLMKFITRFEATQEEIDILNDACDSALVCVREAEAEMMTRYPVSPSILKYVAGFLGCSVGAGTDVLITNIALHFSNPEYTPLITFTGLIGLVVCAAGGYQMGSNQIDIGEIKRINVDYTKRFNGVKQRCFSQLMQLTTPTLIEMHPTLN